MPKQTKDEVATPMEDSKALEGIQPVYRVKDIDNRIKSLKMQKQNLKKSRPKKERSAEQIAKDKERMQKVRAKRKTATAK